jgi:hypothetical protein
MARKQVKSQCKSNCSAANPRIAEHPFSALPDVVQEKLKELSWEKELLLRCTYCGDIWIEKTDIIGNAYHRRVIKVGIDNHVGGEGMIWKIMEYGSRKT